MRITVRTIALTCLLALSAVACDEGGTEAPPQGGGNLDAEAILQQASEDLSEQTVEATFSMDGEFAGESFSMSGAMAIDPANELASMDFEFEGIPGMDPGTNMEMVVDGQTVYMRSPLMPDAGWLKLDAEELGSEDMFGSGQMDPSALLDFLGGADGIEVAGTEEIRGVETTHFSGTIDLADVVAAIPAGEERDAAEEAIDQLEGQMGAMEITFDAWVDASGVPWRFSLEFTPEGLDGSMTMTFDVTELGGEVEIEVPSPNEVTDLGTLDVPAAA